MAITNPCRWCTLETGRHPGCHDKCDKYKQFKKEYTEEQKHIQEERDKYNEMCAWISQQQRRKFHGR